MFEYFALMCFKLHSKNLNLVQNEDWHLLSKTPKFNEKTIHMRSQKINKINLPLEACF